MKLQLKCSQRPQELACRVPGYAATLSPEDAANHIGRTATVCGVVVSTKLFRDGVIVFALTLFLVACGGSFRSGNGTPRKSSFSVSDQRLASGPATIAWNTTYQTIDGFGGSDAALGNIVNPYDTLIFQTLGYSLLRVGTPDDGSCAGISEECARNGGNVTDMQACVANGCKVWATSWDPTAAYSTNASKNCRETGHSKSTLNPADYQAFATYLSNYIASLKQYYGITLYAISPQNEPDVCETYGSSLWPAALFDTFIKDYLGPTLQGNRQSSTMIVMPETGTFGHMATYAGTCMNDPACAAYVGANAFHGYFGSYSASNIYGIRHFWETEIAGYIQAGPNAPGCTKGHWCPGIDDAMMWANIIDYSIAVAGENAWNYWWLVYGDSTNGYLIKQSGEISIRTYVIGNYAKYVRPGWVRIGATHAPQNGVTVSAYKDSTSGAFAIVATNRNASAVNQTFILSGTSPTRVTPTITSASQGLQDLSEVPIFGGSFNYSLPAKSVITFHSP
jgi:glucuronoarabinoxylan endo-1,4-beta-xylanase